MNNLSTQELIKKIQNGVKLGDNNNNIDTIISKIAYQKEYAFYLLKNRIWIDGTWKPGNHRGSKYTYRQEVVKKLENELKSQDKDQLLQTYQGQINSDEEKEFMEENLSNLSILIDLDSLLSSKKIPIILSTQDDIKKLFQTLLEKDDFYIDTSKIRGAIGNCGKNSR